MWSVIETREPCGCNRQPDEGRGRRDQNVGVLIRTGSKGWGWGVLSDIFNWQQKTTRDKRDERGGIHYDDM